MFRQSLFLLKQKLNPFATFYTKLTPTLKQVNVEERMAIAGGLWRATHSEFGTHCNNKRISKAVSLYETNGRSVASVPIISPPSPSASHHRSLMSKLKQSKSHAKQHSKSHKHAGKLSVHKSKRQDAKLMTTKRFAKKLSVAGNKARKSAKPKNVAKKGKFSTSKVQRYRTSMQVANKRNFNFAKVQLPIRSAIMAKPEPVIYLPPSNALIPTQASSAIANSFAKTPTQIRNNIAWHYLGSNGPVRSKANKTHAHKASRPIKAAKQTKAKHASVKAKQHKSHHKQTPTQNSEPKANYENFRAAVLRGRHRPIAEMELRGLQLYYRATHAVTDFNKRIAMGRSFIDALHRKRVQKKFVQQHKQPKKHKSTQKSSHKSAKTHSHKGTSKKSLHFKSSTKTSANLFRAPTQTYSKAKLTKKENRSATKTRKINSLPLPRSLSINRHHHLSPPFLTSRGKIKAAAKRAKLQRRLSATNARSRPVTGSHKQKKSNTVTRINKKAPASRHRFIRFYHAMMSTGMIPNKPPSARSSKIKKLWKLVHHRKTHDERVRLGEDILCGKLSPEKVATLARSASRKPIEQFKKMKFKASNFQFAIVPASKNKNIKIRSNKNKMEKTKESTSEKET